MPLRARPRMLMTVMLLAVTGTLCAGCATSGNFATLSSGACSAFPPPQYQIKGQTSYDQKWADETTEAGVAGCSWHRPKARPPSLKAPIAALPPPKATFRQRWLTLHFRERAQK